MRSGKSIFDDPFLTTRRRNLFSLQQLTAASLCSTIVGYTRLFFQSFLLSAIRSSPAELGVGERGSRSSISGPPPNGTEYFPYQVTENIGTEFKEAHYCNLPTFATTPAPAVCSPRVPEIIYSQSHYHAVAEKKSHGRAKSPSIHHPGCIKASRCTLHPAPCPQHSILYVGEILREPSYIGHQHCDGIHI